MIYGSQIKFVNTSINSPKCPPLEKNKSKREVIVKSVGCREWTGIDGKDYS